MIESASAIPTLAYATPAVDRVSHERVVLRLAGIGAAMLAVWPAISPFFDVYRYSLETRGMFASPRSIFLVLRWLAAPVLVLAAVGALRAARTEHRQPAVRAVRWLFIIAFVMLASPGLAPLALDGGLMFISRWPGWVSAFHLHGLSTQSVYFCLLLVPLLIRYTSLAAASQRRRTLLLAIVMLLFSSGAGIAHVLWKHDRWMNTSVSAALLEACRSALEQPLPLLSAWPLLAWAAIGLLLLSMVIWHRAIVTTAVSCGLVFTFCRAVRLFDWPAGNEAWMDQWQQLQLIVLTAEQVVCDSLPLLLLAWMAKGDVTQQDRSVRR